jgi:hypothetical protein
MSFEDAVIFTLGFEGRYSCDKNDPGGETNYGISKRSYPGEDILNMTARRAKEIYKRDFWDKLNIEDDKLHMAAFDTAVNIGLARTTAFLEGCRTWEDLITRREEYYNNLAIKKPKFQRYLKGWLNRTRALRKLIGG